MLRDKDSKQSIQVTIRVRPLSEKELSQDPRICVKLEQSNSLHLGVGSDIKKFTFDSICFNESQEQIFNRVGKKCTLDCLQGYNCTIFAYGQTGAGKTYTMMGLNFEHQKYFESRGLIPRTMEFLFECIDRERQNGVNFVIRCSFLEIYNEQIIDLLNKSNCNMQLREDTKKGVYVQGVTEELITRSEEAMEILNKGSKSRHVGSTFYNETSSRSHSVFTMQIQSKYAKNGVVNTKSRQFNFIDLAGSERTKQSTGERLKEGCNINKSLMNLAAVINALSEVSEGKMQHVNYRNSKLTFLLKDSLGGNSKTNLIANISPASIFYQQTVSTLGFARRAKLIKRDKASINEDSTGNLQSMKNQIKRLKQQVITLMSRLQNGEGPSTNGQISQSSPNQMTTIMHQYVSQEIDKQTKLQVQILKLNDRIEHLQSGIKHYSNNQIHLRMILSVYQDKVNRLKQVQKMLSEKVNQLNQNDEQSKNIIQYFKSERADLIKQIDCLKKQAQGSKFLKELLKQAKVIKEEGEDDSLRELLAKNSNFLNAIQQKLDQMKPQKLEVEFSTEFEKKVSLIEIQYTKREEELHQRIQQVNLELSDYKTRNQQSQKMLQQAVGVQLHLQQKIKNGQQNIDNLIGEAKISENLIKNLQSEIIEVKNKGEQTANELKQELANNLAQITLLKKEIGVTQSKLQKSLKNQTILKEQFQSLEEEKFKVDKTLLKHIEEMKQQKNIVIKYQSDISMLQQKIQAQQKIIHQSKDQSHKLNEQIIEQKKCFKQKMEELIQKHFNQVQNQHSKRKQVQKTIQMLQKQIKNQKLIMTQLTQELQNAQNIFNQNESQLKQVLKGKQQKINELMSMLSQKQMSDNQTTIKLNQAKIQLFNSNAEKQTVEIKLKKTIDQLKEKVSKEKHSFQLLQNQANERIKIYDALNSQYQAKKRQAFQLSENVGKLNNKLQNISDQLNMSNIRLDEVSIQLQKKCDSEKQHKIQLMQAKNQLFVVQKNAQIQIDAMSSQIKLKDQQIEQLEKQHSKNKNKFQKQIFELEKELVKNRQMFETHEESMKKNMESHLLAKQKKLTEIKIMLQQKQDKIKFNEIQANEMNSIISGLQQDKNKLSTQLNQSSANNKAMSEELQQISIQLNQAKEKHGKQLQQLQIIHGEQIDVKNEQIQSYMIENQNLCKQIEQISQKINKYQQGIINYQIKIEQKQQQINQTLQKNSELICTIQSLKINFEKQKQSEKAKVQSIEREISTKLSETEAQTRQSQFQKEEHIKHIHKIQEEKEILNSQNIKLQAKVKIMTNQINEHLLKVQQLETLLKENKNKIERQEQKLNQTQQNNYKQSKIIEELKRKEEQLNSKIESLQEQIQMKNNETIQLIDTIQKLAKDGEAIQERTDLKIKETEEININLQQSIESLTEQLNIKNNKIDELNLLLNELKHELQAQKINTHKVIVSHKQKQSNIVKIAEEEKIKLNSLIHKLEEQFKQKDHLYCTQINSLVSQCQVHQQLYAKSNQEQEEMKNQINQLIQQVEKQIAQKNYILIQMQQYKMKVNKENQIYTSQVDNMTNQNNRLIIQINNLSKTIKQLEMNNFLQVEAMINLQQSSKNLRQEVNQLNTIKQKYTVQINQIKNIKNQLEEGKSMKQHLYGQLCRQKETVISLKMIIQNSQAQIKQLEVELDQKTQIYNQLLNKIAKNQNQNKKITNSDHYIKAIELLEKSRLEQQDLKRQNQELKRYMKTTMDEKDTYIKQIQKKSENYCITMHKRHEQIQNDYVQLEKQHERVLKEKRGLEKMVSQNESLKEQIKLLKFNASKFSQKYQEVESRLKKCNLDYIQLEKQYEDLKKNQLIGNTTDDKTNYINRLKAEVAALKTQKVLLSDTLNREREEKTKLKADIRYGKQSNGDVSIKVQMEKKLNQNKNLQQLVFEIVKMLDICVVEPKTKLEVIRSNIIGTIKEKNNQIKYLREKIKQCDNMQQTRGIRQNRQLKTLSISNARNQTGVQESNHRFYKDKDPSLLNNFSRQKMKDFQNYYARFRQNEESNRNRNP